jgi:hypothetical protein
MMNKEPENLHMATAFAHTYFHGKKADLKIGDLIAVGFNSKINSF